MFFLVSLPLFSIQAIFLTFTLFPSHSLFLTFALCLCPFRPLSRSFSIYLSLSVSLSFSLPHSSSLLNSPLPPPSLYTLFLYSFHFLLIRSSFVCSRSTPLPSVAYYPRHHSNNHSPPPPPPYVRLNLLSGGRNQSFIELLRASCDEYVYEGITPESVGWFCFTTGTETDYIRMTEFSHRTAITIGQLSTI